MQVTYNQFRQVHPRDWTEPVEVINHGKVIGTWFPAPGLEVSERIQAPAQAMGFTASRVADTATGQIIETKDPIPMDADGTAYLEVDGETIHVRPAPAEPPTFRGSFTKSAQAGRKSK